ncbi:hypothetical protein CLF_103697 [Clonorchis sinensis]|uniref:Uncharacterized protein n=1 Tax=Clonorchis sinensis TaxID=79923 RepID=G7YA83_CLOSI|nr:hypothetical protein CLF_103697 [Clonorchis sinensis]
MAYAAPKRCEPMDKSKLLILKFQGWEIVNYGNAKRMPKHGITSAIQRSRDAPQCHITLHSVLASDRLKTATTVGRNKDKEQDTIGAYDRSNHTWIGHSGFKISSTSWGYLVVYRLVSICMFATRVLYFRNSRPVERKPAIGKTNKTSDNSAELHIPSIVEHDYNRYNPSIRCFLKKTSDRPNKFPAVLGCTQTRNFEPAPEESLVDMEHADVVLIFKEDEKVHLFLSELIKVIPSFGMHPAPTKCKSSYRISNPNSVQENRSVTYAHTNSHRPHTYYLHRDIIYRFSNLAVSPHRGS